jgi:hypothetical protein
VFLDGQASEETEKVAAGLKNEYDAERVSVGINGRTFQRRIQRMDNICRMAEK